MAGESRFESLLIKELIRLYPGAIILKNNANDIQGFPDRLMLFRNRWAAFEVKALRTSSHRPNQDFYVDRLNSMSYASFVYPENKEDFLNGLQQTFRIRRPTRIP